MIDSVSAYLMDEQVSQRRVVMVISSIVQSS